MTTQTRVALRVLAGTPDDIDALQRVLEASPAYAALVTGAPPGAGDAQSVFEALPRDKCQDDKVVLGVFADESMIGCIDVIRGYPDEATAFVGLLLIDERWQGRGFGAAAFIALEGMVRAWTGFARLRLGVLRSNAAAHRFWARHGFVATGETKSYRDGPVSTEIVVYEKLLP